MNDGCTGESTYPFDSIVDPSDVEPETYNDAMASLSDEERRAETIHVNKAAIDVSRRLDKVILS